MHRVAVVALALAGIRRIPITLPRGAWRLAPLRHRWARRVLHHSTSRLDASARRMGVSRPSTPPCYTRRVSTTRPVPAPPSSAETPEERALARKLVRQWEEARAIAEKHHVDVDGVLNVIRGLDLSPAERIELGLRAARLGNVADPR